MNVIDSSAWLAYIADEPNADKFAKAIENTNHLIIPVICLYEVFKVLSRETGTTQALKTIVIMQQGMVVNIDAQLSLNAAQLSLKHQLPMADSLILAITQHYKATLWTQDVDFKEIKGVKYFPKT